MIIVSCYKIKSFFLDASFVDRRLCGRRQICFGFLGLLSLKRCPFLAPPQCQPPETDENIHTKNAQFEHKKFLKNFTEPSAPEFCHFSKGVGNAVQQNVPKFKKKLDLGTPFPCRSSICDNLDVIENEGCYHCFSHR